MSKINNARTSCKDVFHAFLVKNAKYEGYYELPSIKGINIYPTKLIPFSKCLSSKDYDCFIHFYEDDYEFERIWKGPKKYLNILKKFKGVITPDFSLYRDMPLAMQIWNTYRSRAIGSWLQENGINVICNVRWADERSYDFCFDGAPSNSIISIGTHGNIKVKEDRQYFEKGFNECIKVLKPSVTIIYGSLTKNIKETCESNNIKLINFDSEYSLSRRKN